MRSRPSTVADPPFVGAVLAGGRSTRLGRDKALLRIGDRPPLAVLGAEALTAAGAERVVVVGGDRSGLGDLGLEVVDEPAPGAGPLSGIAGALVEAGGSEVVVLACDLPGITAAAVERLRDARRTSGAVVAVASIGGVRQAVIGCWDGAAIGVVEEVLASDRRSVQTALDRLTVTEVTDLPAAVLDDVDDPDDLARYAHEP